MRASIDAARISEDAQALDVLATKLGRDLHCRVLFERRLGERSHSLSSPRRQKKWLGFLRQTELRCQGGISG